LLQKDVAVMGRFLTMFAKGLFQKGPINKCVGDQRVTQKLLRISSTNQKGKSSLTHGIRQ